LNYCEGGDVLGGSDLAGTEGTGGNCAALTACCNAMTGANATNYKTTCQEAVTLGVDSTCATSLQGFQEINACQ
jgi:hypothetical protein